MLKLPFVDHIMKMGKPDPKFGTGEYLLKPEYRKRRQKEDRARIGKGDFALSEMPRAEERAQTKKSAESMTPKERFVQRLMANAGGRVLGPDTNGWEYKSGPFKGMNKAQAFQRATDMANARFGGSKIEDMERRLPHSPDEGMERRLPYYPNSRDWTAPHPKPVPHRFRFLKRNSFPQRGSESKGIPGRTLITAEDRENFAERAKARREYFGGGKYDPAKDRGIIVEDENGNFAAGTRFKDDQGNIHAKGPNSEQEKGVRALTGRISATAMSDKLAEGSETFTKRLMRATANSSRSNRSTRSNPENDGTQGENGADGSARRLQARLNGRKMKPGGRMAARNKRTPLGAYA